MSRRPQPVTREPFGLLAWLNQTRIQLPLREVASRFDVSGDVATVEIDQVFEQTARESLDVTYTFPLPAEAAVYRCELHVNRRIIRAVVMEREEARQIVLEKKMAGFRTALVEMERENLFTLSLGNVSPGDKVTVRFAYLQSLERLGALLSLRIPCCPGLRYIPGQPLLRTNRGGGAQDDTDQVPDASRLSPPRIDASHPDATSLFIEGRVDADDVELRTMSSPSHPMVLRPESHQITVRLAENGQVPDADFVLRWEEPATAQAVARCWAKRGPSGIHALLQIRAPREVAVREDWEQDIYFLLDRSGSMAGAKWTQCAAALQAFVRELGKRDRVWITCFESTYQDFAEAPMGRDALLADRSFRKLAGLGTAGGTELLPALQHVMGQLKRHSKGRRARIVLITDGQVGNDAVILGALAGQPDLPLHCFGIDTAVNDALLESLASQQGGRCVLMTPEDDIAGAVKSLAECLRRPVLTGLCLPGGVQTPSGANHLPDLHVAEVTDIVVHCASGLNSVEVTGSGIDGKAWRTRFDLSTAEETDAPRLLWARQRMRHLIQAGENAAAIELAKEHNMVCEGAAFVAWDESEKVQVARREVYQPSLLPSQYTASVALCAMPPSVPAQAPGSMAGGFLKRRSLLPKILPSLKELAGEYLAPKISTFARRVTEPQPTAPLTPLALADRLLRDYEIKKPDDRLTAWGAAFENMLQQRLMLTAHHTTPFVRLLQHWAMHWRPGRRSSRLASLLQELENGTDPLAILKRFVSQNLKNPYLKDAKEWLAAMAQHSTP